MCLKTAKRKDMSCQISELMMKLQQLRLCINAETDKLTNDIEQNREPIKRPTHIWNFKSDSSRIADQCEEKEII